jgi:ribulose-phosphate 3-epimerase
LGDLDQVLIMLVNPGFAGQRLLPQVIAKIARVRAMLDAAGVSADIAVDGGVTDQVAQELCQAGANVLITGSFVFGVVDRQQAISSLRGASQVKHSG